ncbi:MAG: ABC transporter permease [Acidobacteria bacterium]|nr:ABC transporter permease [Acidobacteriota bacterium]
MRSRPWFTLAAALTLALGIGANTAIFSFVNALLLRPLPYPDADRIVTVESIRGGRPGKLTPREWEELSRETEIFDSVAGWYPSQYNYAEGGEPIVLRSCMTTASLFRVFRVPMEIGDAWDDAQHRERNPVLVMSNALWRRQFGAKPDLAGRTIHLDVAPYRVTGVAAAGFDFPSGMDMYRAASLGGAQNWEVRSLFGVARLQEGVHLGAASQRLQSFAARMESDFPSTNRGVAFRVPPLRESIVGEVRPYVLLTLSLAGAVLLIGCANVVNLLLVRGLARRRELAVRVALGAGRERIIRLLLIESWILALTGGVAGLALAYWWSSVLRDMLRLNLPAWMAVDIDLRVLLFALLIALAAGTLAGLAPALSASKTSLVSVMGEGSRGTSGGVVESRIRSVLVVSELALAAGLLILSGLLVKSFWNLQNSSPGFHKSQLLTFRTDPPWARYNTAEQTALFYRQAIEKLRAIPGVDDAAANQSLPLALNQNYGKPSIEAEGQPLEAAERNPFVNVQIVSPNYFELMGIPLRQGRAFNEEDRLGSTPAVVLSRPLAEHLFGERNPVGQRIRMKGVLSALDESQQSWFTVVGVAQGVHSESLLSGAAMDVYLSNQQQFAGDTFFVLRTQRPAAEIERLAAAALREVDPVQPLFDVRPIEDRINDTIWQRRLAGRLSLLFGGLAVALAALGIYSVLAYSVSQRSREMGIRQALGATPRQLRGLILGQGLGLAAPGILLGCAAAGLTARVLAPLLHEVSPYDVVVYATAPTLLFVISALACLLPAIRASRVDLISALRAD